MGSLEREVNQQYSDHEPSADNLSDLRDKVRSSSDEIKNQYMERMKLIH